MNKPIQNQNGFILIFSILMLLGISTVGIGMVYNAHHGQIAAQNYKNRMRAFYSSDGLRALLAQEIVDGNASNYLSSISSGPIYGDVYVPLAGIDVATLKAAISSPPTKIDSSNYLGSNLKTKTDYGVRWKGFILPPSSGAYNFMARCDDACEFFLSTDESASNLSSTPIVFITSETTTWPISGSGLSNSIALKVGKRYYFEFFHKQDKGVGLGEIVWKGPDALIERPIPGSRIAASGAAPSKWDTTMVDNHRVRYMVVQSGPLIFSLNTESILGGVGDSTFRSPLQQVLSLRDANSVPDSVYMHVIYYDFHADGSNPEFQRYFSSGSSWGTKTGMVRTDKLKYTLVNANYFGRDSIGKPMLGANPQYNCGVDKWFSPWQSGWFKTYNYMGGASDCSESPQATDNAFINVMIKDSLKFIRQPLLGPNTYRFKAASTGWASPDFDPLFNRGFGQDGGYSHNYSFCMELHSEFEHTSGISISFNGDDDVWVFINDSLVIDLGYIHPPRYGDVNLDDLPLTYGNIYPFDFFYCERQAYGSNIDLILNLPVKPILGKPRSNWKRDYGGID